MNDFNLELDKKIKESKCVPGINYFSVEEDNNILIFEIYLKNKDEYKVVGMWTRKKESDKLPEYCQVVYDELKNQGLCEAGCMYIALDVRDEKDSKLLMDYLISVREKHISYTELWEEKNKIIKYDLKNANKIKKD